MIYMGDEFSRMTAAEYFGPLDSQPQNEIQKPHEHKTQTRKKFQKEEETEKAA